MGDTARRDAGPPMKRNGRRHGGSGFLWRREIADGLAFQRHRMLAGLQVREVGIELRGEGDEGLGPARSRHEEIDELAVHRFGGALQVADREGAAGFAALKLRIGLLRDAGLLRHGRLGQTQGLTHGAQPTAGRLAGALLRGNQGGQLFVQIGQKDVLEGCFHYRLCIVNMCYMTSHILFLFGILTIYRLLI